VSGPEKKKELSSEMRILVASLLSMAVILLWVKFFAPKPPANVPQANKPAVTAPATSTNSAGTTTSSSPASGKPNALTTPGIATAIAPANAAALPPTAATEENNIVVENDLYRVEFSNRGGIVKSWQLKKYKDDSKPQKVLDVVHPDAAAQVGGWPFSLALDDQQLEAQANSALYEAWVPEPGARAGDLAAHYAGLPASPLKAPKELEFVWSDGHFEVTKSFRFDDSYVVRVETIVKVNGTPVKSGIAWRGGFGDLTVSNPAPVDTVFTFSSEGGKLTDLPYKKLEGPEKWGPGVWMGSKDYAGIEDKYFTAAFLPVNGIASGSLETRYWKEMRTVHGADGKEEQEPVSEVAATTSTQPMALRVYVGPKDYDDLKAMKPPLQALVNFGFMEFIAEPLFHGLKWLHKYVTNWGWAIIVMTLVINMLLFPLRISSYKTTLKMQRVGPEVKAIQERYKKYKLNDPKKQEMNKEVMAIYSREGINPVGGCFQMFLQMPIWFGLNSALRGTIELRHAHWLWIADLASKDPYYVLPVVVGVSMYLVSKMTPMTAGDPQQQQMMKIMPIMFAGSFIIFPFSSGLALYILTSSLVGIVQQWYLNRTHPAPAAAKQISRGKK